MVIAFSSLGPTRHHCTICPFHVRSLAITCKKHVCLLIETDSPVEKSSHMFKVCLSPYPPQKHNLPRFVGFVERIGFFHHFIIILFHVSSLPDPCYNVKCIICCYFTNIEGKCSSLHATLIHPKLSDYQYNIVVQSVNTRFRSFISSIYLSPLLMKWA